MPNLRSFFDQLPFARSLERRGTSDEGIQHVTPVIGYHDSTPPTLGRGFNNLAKKPAIHRIFVDPLLADGKSPHLLNCPLDI
jgi:hypothetical protein